MEPSKENTPNKEENKPCACESKPPANKSSRRDFLLKVGFGLNFIAGAMISVPIVGYAISSFFRRMPLKKITLGPIDKFPEGTTRLAEYENPYKREWDGDTAQIPCWVRRIEGEKFQIFAINCTHLGCPVRWFDESKLFMCPCHGGVYYQDGARASGPPPRALYSYEYSVENGVLYIMGGILPTLADTNV